MKFAEIKETLLTELRHLGLKPQADGELLSFDYRIHERQAPLRYTIHVLEEPRIVEVRVAWDLVAKPLTTELLTFLTYLNSVEEYGHFYVAGDDCRIYYKMTAFYRDFDQEPERTRRILGIPVRAFGSAANELHALLEEGESALSVYHRWMQHVLETQEAERIKGDTDASDDTAQA